MFVKLLNEVSFPAFNFILKMLKGKSCRLIDHLNSKKMFVKFYKEVSFAAFNFILKISKGKFTVHLLNIFVVEVS